jgi:hypothetical protein
MVHGDQRNGCCSVFIDVMWRSSQAVQTAFQPPVVIKRVEDPRLARLAQSRAQPDSDGEEPAARHRRTVVVRWAMSAATRPHVTRAACWFGHAPHAPGTM